MTNARFYDYDKTYDDNYDTGPFNMDENDYRTNDQPAYEFLGHKINFPFGIAAGSLPTHRHTDAAFRLGYDVVCYKTQRSGEFPCNPFPNVLPIEIDGDLTLERLAKPLVVSDSYPSDSSNLSITNSFGVPSRGPSVWVDDVKKALMGAGDGQLLIMSVVGTIKEGFTPDEYYTDFAVAAKEAKDAGANVVEVNLSCPNVASEGVICYSEDAVYEICTRVKAAIGETPLVIKVGYYRPEQQKLLETIVARIAPHVAAISAINTLAGEIVTKDGEQALPGPGRLKSGVCGAGIKWAGLDMMRRLDTLRKAKGYTYEIIGVGGVMSAADYQEYRSAGADVVQSVTGAMWNQYLARDIKKSV
ncbi:diguanylate cyclase [Candidatus Saccharibacteria bacterium]|nr:diguanylate cyclase [Candidatus Saccharibacteria bacterium]